MPTLYFEDFPAGSDLPEARLEVEPEDASSFVAAFGAGAADPDAPVEGPLPLSGFHVAALGMRLLFEAFIWRTASLGAPGIDEVTWPKPVRSGDGLRFTARVEAARVSASRPEMGLVTVAISIFNQDDDLVMTQRNAVMVARRGADRGGPEAEA